MDGLVKVASGTVSVLTLKLSTSCQILAFPFIFFAQTVCFEPDLVEPRLILVCWFIGAVQDTLTTL